MDTLFIPVGGFVFVIALFKRELLVERESFRLISGVSALLFVAGLALHFSAAWRDSDCGALLVPLIALGFYRLCRKIFLRLFEREPRDTYLDWSPGMGADRLFNIVYFVFGWFLWMSVTILMLELAKHGW
jgi:hypothetical protein